MIVMCTCGRVKIRKHLGILTDAMGAGWAELADPDPSQPNAITHNLCPECAEKANRDVIVARLGRFSGGKDETEGGA